MLIGAGSVELAGTSVADDDAAFASVVPVGRIFEAEGVALVDDSRDTAGLPVFIRRKAARAAASRAVVGSRLGVSPLCSVFADGARTGSTVGVGVGATGTAAGEGAGTAAVGTRPGGFWPSLRASCGHGCQTPPGP